MKLGLIGANGSVGSELCFLLKNWFCISETSWF